MLALPDALVPMAAYRQFILWQAVWDAGKNKYQKKPISPTTGFPHNPHDPSIWMDAETAMGTAQLFGEGYGFGFVLTEADPFWFLDIDNCATDGQWSPLAQQLLAMLPGAAVEVSYSGTGLHIFGTGQIPAHGCKNIPLDLEFYHAERFVALTGNQAYGSASLDCSAALAQVVPYYFPVGADTGTGEGWTEEADPEWSGPEDDEKLIQKMLASRGSAGSVFGGKASVADLWVADIDKLSAAYPDGYGDKAFDHSSADAALCQHLAFWTGKNCERIDRLFRQSALYRDKWERPDYRENTVLKAAGLCNAVYSSGKKKDAVVYTDADATAPSSAQITVQAGVSYKEGLQYLAPSNQVELFVGCVYVRDIHAAYIPDGALLKSEQFRAAYGGYIFALDAINDKITKNAWEVFTESQAVRFPRAHTTCFRPELEPGLLLEESGQVLVNTYVPVDTPSTPGDVTPFLNHLATILPEETDRAILLAYMAACIQYKGTKFRWAPLIQGVEGNGKSLISEVMINAIGSKYIHKPNAQELGSGASKFTGWLHNKLFIAIEEVHTGGRREVMDALKPIITDARLEVQLKGVDQGMMDNRANFIMCSNYKDAVIKVRTDRRYCLFFTAQQTSEDLYRAGMVLADGATPTRYFPDLFKWLETGGYAHINYYLQTYQIPEQLNPATLCTRAPATSSTEEAIAVSLGGVEQEVNEAVEQELPGFAGGWVSSMGLDRLLKARRDDKRIPPAKRKELMETLGYIVHPGLHKGRVNVNIPLDAGKPRLYVKRDSIQSGIQGAAAIADAYIKAQGSAAGAQGTAEQVFGK